MSICNFTLPAGVPDAPTISISMNLLLWNDDVRSNDNSQITKFRLLVNKYVAGMIYDTYRQEYPYIIAYPRYPQRIIKN